MAEAKINESCIIGLPTCGYAFSSSRMAFIATPSDEEFSLELDILQGLLSDKEYEAYIALQQVDPAKLAFCTKICSKIITSQFCIVLLNSSTHRDHPTIKIPNPNVHMEYGLMMAFKKHIIPFQQEGDALAFNIRPLDTIMYTKSKFKQKADSAIDDAILKTGTTSRPTRALVSNEAILKYLAVRSLQVTDVSTTEANTIYRLGSALGYLLLDGEDIIYFGLFDQETAREVVFRLKLLIQNLSQSKTTFDTVTSKTMTPKQVENSQKIWNRIKIEVFVSTEIDKNRVTGKVDELTKGMLPIDFKLLNENDIQVIIDKEYSLIGNI